MRVVVVSEDAAERRRATSALALLPDTEVVEVASGEDARRRYLDGELLADVLVVDNDLWPRGGFALLYDLHEQADQHGTDLAPSVVLTSREPDRFLVDWSQASRSVAKPIDSFDLARVVGELGGVGPPQVATSADAAGRDAAADGAGA